MNNLNNAIEKAKAEIRNFNNHNVDLVYAVARSLWCCYSNVDVNVSPSLSKAFDLVLYCVEEQVTSNGSSLIRKTDISLAQLPVHLASAVKNTNNEMFQDVIEYVNACKNNLENPYMADIVKKLFLMLIFQVLRNIPGSDIYSLINKCIVLDHLGNDVTRGSKIDITLKRLNDKAALLLKRGEQISDIEYMPDILLLVGKLNYRLNNYTEAIRFLSIYAKQLVKQNKEKTIDGFVNKLAKIYIFIGYCYEKKIAKDQLQSLQSLNIAINLFEDIQNNRKCFHFDDCNNDIQTEIFHGLAHFYNERAVFHASLITIEQQNNDIMHAQKYISIAKEMDNRDAFHSCHGLICYENRDYERAATIYEGAKNLQSIINNDELRSEIEFYQAQTMSALGDNPTANELLDKVESYVKSIYNDDAIVHVRILRIKSQLAELELFGRFPKNSNFFHELLNSLLEKKLSMYAPTSIEIERRKIAFALNIFYYICRIREDNISFEAGIEEIVYNLRKYYSTNTSLEKRQRIRISEKSPEPESEKEITYVEDFRSKQREEDAIFLLEVNGVQLVCFGKDLSGNTYEEKNNFGIGYKKKIKAEFESKIVEQIKSNQRPDVILLNSSTKLATDYNRKRVLQEIIMTGVCVVALGEDGERIAKDSCTTPQASDKIYRANTERELIQMGYLFRVYEMLRCDLTMPTPLLGLAPLSRSKSFSFQTCQEINNLFIPSPSVPEVHFISPFALVIKALESTQIEHFYRARKLKEFNNEFNQIISCVMPNITFLAFFPMPQDRNDLNFRVPYAIFDTDFFTSYNYALSTIELKKTVSHKPFVPYYADYVTLNEEIKKRATSFCKRKNCNQMTCFGGVVLLSDSKDSIRDTIHNLISKIFPMPDSFPNYYSLCCTFNDSDMSGIYVVMIKNNLRRTELEQNARSICKTIHNVAIAQKVQTASKTPEGKNSKKQEAIHEDVAISFAKEHVIWEVLSDLKSKLEKATDSAEKMLRTSGTREEVQKRYDAISKSIQQFIKIVNEVFSKRMSKFPKIDFSFFESAKKIIEDEGWDDYLNDDMKECLNNIIKYSEQGGH
jgi:hypothetical protein